MFVEPPEPERDPDYESSCSPVVLIVSAVVLCGLMVWLGLVMF